MATSSITNSNIRITNIVILVLFVALSAKPETLNPKS